MSQNAAPQERSRVRCMHHQLLMTHFLKSDGQIERTPSTTNAEILVTLLTNFKSSLFDRACADRAHAMGFDASLAILHAAAKASSRMPLFSNYITQMLCKQQSPKAADALLLLLIYKKSRLNPLPELLNCAQSIIIREIENKECDCRDAVLELTALLAPEHNEVPSDEAFHALADFAEPLAFVLTEPQSLALLAFSLAERKLLNHPTAFQIALRIMHCKKASLSPLIIATLISAFSEAKYIDEAFLRFATERMAACADRASFDELELFLTRLAPLNFCYTERVAKIVDTLLLRFDSNNRSHFHGICKVFMNLAELGFRHKALCEALTEHEGSILQPQPILSPRNLARLAWAATVLEHPLAERFFDAAINSRTDELTEYHIGLLGRASEAQGWTLPSSLAQAFNQWRDRALVELPEMNIYEVEIGRELHALGYPVRAQRDIGGFHGDLLARCPTDPKENGVQKCFAVELNGNRSHRVLGDPSLITGADLMRRLIYRAKNCPVIEISAKEWTERSGAQRRRWLSKKISLLVWREQEESKPSAEAPEATTLQQSEILPSTSGPVATASLT